MIPISFAGSGPDRANVKNPATTTAAAAKITRPKWARPSTIASSGSSQCSFRFQRASLSYEPVDAYRKAERAHSGQLRSDRPSFWSGAGACRT